MEATMSLPDTFGGRLRAFREGRGLTQEQLSDAVGITPLSLHRYESGVRVPQWDVVVKLADALGVRLDDFRTDDDGQGGGQPDEPAGRPLGKRK